MLASQAGILMIITNLTILYSFICPNLIVVLQISSLTCHIHVCSKWSLSPYNNVIYVIRCTVRFAYFEVFTNLK